MSTQTKSRVKTASTAFAIIEAVQKLDQPTISTVAEEVELAKSTVYAHLNTLVDEGYLIREGDTYRIGLKFLHHGMYARDNVAVSKVVQPFLEQMVDQTGEIAWLLVEENGMGVYLNKAMGEHAVQPVGRIGKHVNLHHIAAGKAILAHLPEDRVHEIVGQHGLEAWTPNTITDRDELLLELDRIRDRGYATNDNETFIGFRAVASPILIDGEIQGSIVISAPLNRMKGKRFTETIPELVTGTANAVELSLMTTHQF